MEQSREPQNKNKTGPLSYTTNKNESKRIKELNIRPETINLLEENIRGEFLDIGLGHEFFGFDTYTKGTKAKMNKWDYIKLKSFCTA